MLVTCNNCEVEVNPAFLNCRFCHQQILPHQERHLASEQKKELLTFAKAMNDKLTEKKKTGDPVVFSIFIVLFLLLVGLGFLMDANDYSTGRIIIAILAVGLIFFTGWGGMIETIERRYMKKAYYTDVHKDVVNFLEARGYYRYELDMVVTEKMRKNTPMKLFAFDSNVEELQKVLY